MWSSASPGWPVAESPVGSPRRMSASTEATLATVAESLQGGAMKRDLSVENEFSVYVGLDWGTEFHRACVLNSRGEILRECRIDHSGQAISDFVRGLNEMGNGKPDHVGGWPEATRQRRGNLRH